MRIVKFLLIGLLVASPVFAEEADDRQTATSLHYVSHELDTRQNKLTTGTNAALTYTNTAGNVEQRTVKENLNGGTTDTSLPQVNAVNAGLDTKQNDIAAINDHTAVTYTGQTGQIGQKGIYQDSGTYAEQSDNLIDAKTFNAALKIGLDSEFVCSDADGSHDPVSGECWLWMIHNNVTSNGILPNGYTPLEYIESTGTQYINTEIYWHSGYSIKMDFTSGLASGNKALFGASNGNNATTGEVAVFWNSGRIDRVVPRSNSTSSNVAFGTYLENTRYTLTYDNNKTSVSSIGAVTNQNFYADYVGTRPITLFAVNRSDGALYNGAFRIHSVQIYDNNNTLIRNFIPAKNSSNFVGLYDTVSERFFPNAATSGDDFAAGQEINSNIYLPQGQ